MPSLSIISALPAHETGWRDLWNQYCGGAVTQEVSDATWRRIVDPSSSIGSIVALLENQVVGFITYVEHECTWETQTVCYIEDVFVSKHHRGSTLGVGHAIARHLIERLQAGEWARVYGITHTENILAQRLYGRYTHGEPYLRYVMRVNAQ